jgi:hypothetical protein
MPSAILRQFSVLCCACTIPIRKSGSAAAIAAKVGFTIFRWKLSCTSHTHTHTHTARHSKAQHRCNCQQHSAHAGEQHASQAEPSRGKTPMRRRQLQHSWHTNMTLPGVSSCELRCLSGSQLWFWSCHGPAPPPPGSAIPSLDAGPCAQ